MLGKLVWGTTKVTVKYVVVPIVYTAIMAAVISAAADKIRGATPQDRPEPVITPEP